MKTFNYLLSMLLCVATFYVFVTSKSDKDLLGGVIVMAGAIIFFCFALLEERNEEISELKKRLLGRL